ncbi:sensory box histidine kinase/response regulator [Enhygromyxa salina]|uniref:histidine kinase n=1 Tax=Enhygromyxa salina TaxID=215803 RepID=A0A0C2CPA5_9BACT|nr:ATP-binding protein [Enhygromyxa salina]KIG13046.1 sensory box histidine kinase/response regulator [Enhygromyxa salina]
MTDDDRVGVCLLDAAGNIVDIDEEFVALLALPTPSSLVGRAFADVSVAGPALLGLAEPSSPTPTTRARLEVAGALVEVTCKARVAPPGHTLLVRPLVSAGFAPDPEGTRRRLDLILESSPLAILCLDNDRNVTVWSGAAERTFGFTRDEVLGKPYPLVPAEQLASFDQLWTHAMTTGEGFTAVEGTRQRKDGSRIELRMHTALLHDDDGAVTGSMALLEDLTQTRQLEQRMHQSQKLEAIGSLAGGIAHEFNNLLAVIIGMGELLELDRSLGPVARDRVVEIQRVTRAARELVAQVMTFSRRYVVRPVVFDLNERVRSGVKIIRHMLVESIEFVVELGDQPLPVRLDPMQFDQLLLNLAINAVDAMPGGGRLICKTSRVERSTGSLTAPRLAAPFVCLEVRDTGTGIAPDVLPHVFDPFFTTKQSGSSTGLGLANVHAVASQEGGHVEVQTREGEGSCFSVFLPLMPLEQVAASPKPCPAWASAPRGKERILLVEDNDGVRKSTARLLRVLGYEVGVAEDGVEALELLEGGLVVELVLTDVSMPRLGGADLAKQLYARAPELPILFMSGNLDVAELREQVEQGRISFLQKPATLQELAIATREILDAVG